MLLQEFFFRNALNENSIDIKNLTIDHKNAICTNDNINYSIIFPISMVKKIEDITSIQVKKYMYFYRGVNTENKKWILDFCNRSDSIIQFSTYGRNANTKYILDEDYYTKMASSYFTLCPTDVFNWSYRFLEAIVTKTIPIIGDDNYDIHSHRFKYYKKSDIHVYKQDWVDYNIEQFYKYHTIQLSPILFTNTITTFTDISHTDTDMNIDNDNNYQKV